jgi:fructose-bisphosphate aldolase class II
VRVVHRKRFSSVMIDGSNLPFEMYWCSTAASWNYAHRYDVTVEGELGCWAGNLD